MAQPPLSPLKIVPWKQVAEHVDALATDLDALLGSAQSSLERNNRNVSLFNLGRRALVELWRVSTMLEEDIATVAWSTRNLYEIDLMLRYVSRDEDATARWAAQIVHDEKEMIDGWLVVARETGMADAVTGLEERRRQLLAVPAAIGLSLKGPQPTGQLAETVGRRLEYDAVYKILSKFSHPSSWLVNWPSQRKLLFDPLQFMAGLTQVLAGRIRFLLLDGFGMSANDIRPSTRSSEWEPAPS